MLRPIEATPCFEIRRSKIKVSRHKNSASVVLCTLVSAGFLWFLSFSCCDYKIAVNKDEHAWRHHVVGDADERRSDVDGKDGEFCPL